METVIQVEHLTKKYGSQTAVDDLSFIVKKGTVFGLLGQTGQAKAARSSAFWEPESTTPAGSPSWSRIPPSAEKSCLNGSGYSFRRQNIRN